MKRFFLTLSFLILLFFPLTTKLSAQLPELSFPGINCGVAGNVKTERCCTVLHPTVPSLFSTGQSIIDDVINFFYSTIPSLFLGKIQPLIDQQANLSTPCQVGLATADASDLSCRCVADITPSPGYLVALNDFCNRQTNSNDQSRCVACANAGGVFSGVGCIKTDMQAFIKDTVFSLGIGLAGGFALLCIIYAAFQMQSSQGNPEKLKKAQELITSCIMGLMLIIFSVFILRLIGVNILRIPGFG